MHVAHHLWGGEKSTQISHSSIFVSLSGNTNAILVCNLGIAVRQNPEDAKFYASHHYGYTADLL